MRGMIIFKNLERGMAQFGLERCVRDAEVAGSSPAAPTMNYSLRSGSWQAIMELEG